MERNGMEQITARALPRILIFHLNKHYYPSYTQNAHTKLRFTTHRLTRNAVFADFYHARYEVSI